MRIEKLSVYQLCIPLSVPYRLAFGEIRSFNTILVEAHNQDGTLGIGEATLLPGYSDETMEANWPLACQLAEEIARADFEDARGILTSKYSEAPFTVTAFITALEMMEGHPLLQVMQSEHVPILGVVHGETAAELESDIEHLLKQGYSTLKVKVGFDADADLQRVSLIQQLISQRAQIRLDANQGYSRQDALRFATRLNPEGIELLEQPCAADDWEGAYAVAQVSSVPMMLDESIFGQEDIERAAELNAASYIKLKLMKTGGLSRLAEDLKFIRERGMTPVMGNGVATDVGCWMEACVARKFIDNAGEMNGFLKPDIRLLCDSLAFNNGAIVLAPDFSPVLDRAALSECLRAEVTF